MEGGKQLAPWESGGASLETGWSEFVTADELATKQVNAFFAEETWLDLGAQVGLGALAVILNVLASQPGACLARIELSQKSRRNIRQASDEGAVTSGSEAGKQMVAVSLGETAVCHVERPSLTWLALGFDDAGLEDCRGDGWPSARLQCDVAQRDALRCPAARSVRPLLL